MADLLEVKGRVLGMQGIIDGVGRAVITTAEELVIYSLGSLSAADFTVSEVTGTVTNDIALVFLITSEDIGRIASKLKLQTSGTADLITVDLNDTVTFNYEGEATIAAGALDIRL